MLLPSLQTKPIYGSTLLTEKNSIVVTMVPMVFLCSHASTRSLQSLPFVPCASVVLHYLISPNMLHCSLLIAGIYGNT